MELQYRVLATYLEWYFKIYLLILKSRVYSKPFISSLTGYTIVGTGDPEECLNLIKKKFNLTNSCPYSKG